MSVNNIPSPVYSTKYSMKPANVKANIYVGNNKPQMLVSSQQDTQEKTQYKTTQNTEEKKGRNSKKYVIAGTGLVLAILGAGLIFKSPKIRYMYGNLGKKGINNFMQAETNEDLKAAINFVCKETPFKSEIDKMGIKNIRNIADSVLEEGVSDLMASKGVASIASYVPLPDGRWNVNMPIINFENKKGFDLYNEIMRAKSYCNLKTKLLRYISQIFKQSPGSVLVEELNPAETGTAITKGYNTLEINKHGQDWAVTAVLFPSGADRIRRYIVKLPTNVLKSLDDGPVKNFREFLSVFGGKSHNNILLGFEKFFMHE